MPRLQIVPAAEGTGHGGRTAEPLLGRQRQQRNTGRDHGDGEEGRHRAVPFHVLGRVTRRWKPTMRRRAEHVRALLPMNSCTKKGGRPPARQPVGTGPWRMSWWARYKLWLEVLETGGGWFVERDG